MFAHEGIRVLTDAETTRVAYAHGTFTLTLGDGQELSADKLLVAAGRKTNLQDLDLFTVGLDPSVHTLEVDDRMRVTGVDRLWAIGDVTGKGAFTHVSMYQSAIARRDILGEDGPPAAYHAVPHVTFTDPEVAGVGMTEAQARDAGLTVRTGIHQAGGVLPRLHARPRRPRPGQGRRGRRPGRAGRRHRRSARPAARSSASSPSRCTPRCRWPRCRSMIYAYPTFHRAIESALADLS